MLYYRLHPTHNKNTYLHDTFDLYLNHSQVLITIKTLTIQWMLRIVLLLVPLIMEHLTFTNIKHMR
jgi:hypothetical protein